MSERGGGNDPQIPIIELSTSNRRQQSRSQRTTKARFRVLDSDGKPVGGVRLNVIIDTGPDEQRILQMRAGPTGYATLDLTNLDVASVDEFVESAREITVEPVTSDDGVEISPEALLETGAVVVELPDTRDSYPSAEVEDGYTTQAFMRPPDSEDAENAPELFNPAVVEENGNCSIDFTANVDVHENFFNQIIRVSQPESDDQRIDWDREPTDFDADTDPDLAAEDGKRELLGQMPFELTKDYPPADGLSPDIEDWPYLEKASEPRLGVMNVYKQTWTKVGHSVGKLLHSLSLAPCESTEVSIVEWSRTERGRREERTSVGERKSHELHRDRMIQEAVDGVTEELQAGASASGQLGFGRTSGAGVSKGPATASFGRSLGGGGAISGSVSYGRRELQASTVHNLSDNIVQSASSLRSLRSTVVTQSQEVERDQVRTRAVDNPNRNHAMTVEYFQVLEHYNVHTDLADEMEVLLIPYDLPLELWDEPPAYELFSFRKEMQHIRRNLQGIGSEVASEDPISSGLVLGNGEVKLRAQLVRSVEAAVDAALSDATAPTDLSKGVDDIGYDAWRRFSDRAAAKIAGSTDLDRDAIFIAEDGGVRLKQQSVGNVSTLQEVQSAVRDRILTALSNVQTGDVLNRSDLVAWLDRNAEKLRDFVPVEHEDAFDALYRLVHTPEVYEASKPGVTASSWTVELREAWRPGVTILIHTTKGQTVTLDHDSGTEGSAVASFSSPPVDIGAIDAIEVNFAPEKATKTTVKSVGKAIDDVAEEVGPAAEKAADIADEAGDILGTLGDVLGGKGSGSSDGVLRREIEKARTFTIDSIRVTAHTDPMDALPQSKSYELLDPTSVDTTLTANDPSKRFGGITAPEPNLLETETRRYEDYSKVEALIDHIQANRMAYLRQLWMNEDPNKRALRFQRYTYPIRRNGTSDEKQVPLLNLVENEPLGVVGNSVAFRLLEQGQLDDQQVPDDDLSESRFVSLPTRGVYAETLLSHCNATEIRDLDRIPTERTRCRTEAPEITGVSPGSRRSEDRPQPNVPDSTVNLQQPPTAPRPTGLSEALRLLSAPNIFRDMSLGSETVDAANALARKALSESGEARQQTLEQLASTLPRNGVERGDGERFEAARKTIQDAAQTAANEAYRRSDPVRNRDHLRNAMKAEREGSIDNEDLGTSTKRVLNADQKRVAGLGDESSTPAGMKADDPICRAYPVAFKESDKSIVDIKRFDRPVKQFWNWGLPDVHHFTKPKPPNGNVCRSPKDVTEIIVHETAAQMPYDVADLEKTANNSKPLGVHFSIDRDGTIRQHNDVVDWLRHASGHNDVSVAIEILNPGPLKNTARDASQLPTIKKTKWPSLGNSAPDEIRTYVLPTHDQVEAAAQLIHWLTGSSEGHGLGIPSDWIGMNSDGKHFLMDNNFKDSTTNPGIWAHGYFDHADGYFIVLYAWLRLASNQGQGMPADKAWSAVKTLADEEKHPPVSREDGVFHVDVSNYI
jgi:hypothetical protein